MKFLIVGTYLDEQGIEEFNAISSAEAQISISSVKYTKMIYDGVCENAEDVEQIFLAPIGMFPQTKTLKFDKRKNGRYAYLKFINIIFIKQLSIVIDLFLQIMKWRKKYRNETTTVIFTFVYLPFFIAVLPLKIFTRLKVVTFVPDLPAFSFSYSHNGNFLKELFVPIYIYFANKLSYLTDYFVFITDHMKNLFPGKPYSVIEGFVGQNVAEKEATFNSESIKKNAIMYSGSLFRKFGIENLLKAFMSIDGDYELWLYGTGDMVGEIQEAAQMDSRIKYFGQVPNNIVVAKQPVAKFLINPRFTHEEFTKFSFPSKLMEYLASGTPVITTRLPGIPPDYNDKFYFIDDETVAGLKKTIEYCLKKTSDELEEFGKKGRKYVLDEKNNITLIKKLLVDLRSTLNFKTR